MTARKGEEKSSPSLWKSFTWNSKMTRKISGNKEILGDSACPDCRSKGQDETGNHLLHMRNLDTQEEFASCNRCGYNVVITDGNRADLESIRNLREELTEEELEAILSEAEELPIMALDSRSIRRDVAERYKVRVGLSQTNREVNSHFYPKTKDGILTSFKIRNLDPKYFYAIGNGSGCDFFGEEQAKYGDVFSGKLFIFEDELSAMSGYQCLVDATKSTYKPACVSLPDGAASIASVFSRRRKFLESFQEIVVCMDNDGAGEEAVGKARALYPQIKVARIPRGKKKDGSLIKDANDLLMEGRGVELNNCLRFNASTESPAGAVTVSECLEDALKKPEWGLDYPWKV